MNCPWSSYSFINTSYAEPVYSAADMRMETYTGFIGSARMSNLLFFDWNDMTEDILVHEAAQIALETLDLQPALQTKFPTVQPRLTLLEPASTLHGRAFAEAVPAASIYPFCIHAIVLNIANDFKQIFALVEHPQLNKFRAINMSLPYEQDADRLVLLSEGAFRDTVGPRSVNVYRIGCEAETDPNNQSPNPSFELPSLFGGVTFWSSGRGGWWAGDGHDLRFRNGLTTVRPQHGRYATWWRLPTDDLFTTPWTVTEDSPSGFVLEAYTEYTVRMWARTDHDGPNVRFLIVSGDWIQSPAEANAIGIHGTYIRNETHMDAIIDGEWKHVSVTIQPFTTNRRLQLQFQSLKGPGKIYGDNTYIAVNLTSPGRALDKGKH